MADNDMDSGLDIGTASSPNGAGSGGKSDSGSSLDAGKLQSAIEALTKQVAEVDSRTRALQGDKDRGVKKAEGEIDELRRKVAELEKLKKAGYDDDAAFAELSFREEVRAVKEGLSRNQPAPPDPAGNGTGKAVDLAKAIKEYGLDGNDPDVIAKVLNQSYGSQVEAELAAARLAFQRVTAPPPNPAASTATVGTPVSNNSSDVVAKLTKLQKDPIRNRDEIKKLEKELGW